MGERSWIGATLTDMAIVNTPDGDQLLNDLAVARKTLAQVSAVYSYACGVLWTDEIKPLIMRKFPDDWEERTLINFRSDPDDDEVNGGKRCGVALQSKVLRDKDVLVDVETFELSHPGVVAKLVDRGLIEVVTHETSRVLLSPDLFSRADAESEGLSMWKPSSQFDTATRGGRLHMVLSLHVALAGLRKSEQDANKALATWLSENPSAKLPGVVGMPILFPLVMLGRGGEQYARVDSRSKGIFYEIPQFGTAPAWVPDKVFKFFIQDEAEYAGPMDVCCDHVVEPGITAFRFNAGGRDALIARNKAELSRA